LFQKNKKVFILIFLLPLIIFCLYVADIDNDKSIVNLGFSFWLCDFFIWTLYNMSNGIKRWNLPLFLDSADNDYSLNWNSMPHAVLNSRTHWLNNKHNNRCCQHHAGNNPATFYAILLKIDNLKNSGKIIEACLKNLKITNKISFYWVEIYFKFTFSPDFIIALWIMCIKSKSKNELFKENLFFQ
jgi:hypothetical protein